MASAGSIRPPSGHLPPPGRGSNRSGRTNASLKTVGTTATGKTVGSKGSSGTTGQQSGKTTIAGSSLRVERDASVSSEEDRSSRSDLSRLSRSLSEVDDESVFSRTPRSGGRGPGRRHSRSPSLVAPGGSGVPPRHQYGPGPPGAGDNLLQATRNNLRGGGPQHNTSDHLVSSSHPSLEEGSSHLGSSFQSGLTGVTALSEAVTAQRNWQGGDGGDRTPISRRSSVSRGRYETGGRHADHGSDCRRGNGARRQLQHSGGHSVSGSGGRGGSQAQGGRHEEHSLHTDSQNSSSAKLTRENLDLLLPEGAAVPPTGGVVTNNLVLSSFGPRLDSTHQGDGLCGGPRLLDRSLYQGGDGRAVYAAAHTGGTPNNDSKTPPRLQERTTSYDSERTNSWSSQASSERRLQKLLRRGSTVPANPAKTGRDNPREWHGTESFAVESEDYTGDEEHMLLGEEDLMVLGEGGAVGGQADLEAGKTKNASSYLRRWEVEDEEDSCSARFMDPKTLLVLNGVQLVLLLVLSLGMVLLLVKQ